MPEKLLSDNDIFFQASSEDLWMTADQRGSDGTIFVQLFQPLSLLFCFQFSCQPWIPRRTNDGDAIDIEGPCGHWTLWICNLGEECQRIRRFLFSLSALSIMIDKTLHHWVTHLTTGLPQIMFKKGPAKVFSVFIYCSSPTPVNFF